MRGYEAGSGPGNDGDGDVVVFVVRRGVVDRFYVFGDLVGAGEVKGVGLRGVTQGDVEGGGVGEGLDQMFERVLVGGSTVFVREEGLGGPARAHGGTVGDDEGFDVVALLGHGGACSCCSSSSSTISCF